jgi:protein-S-isoprenylcysteine O-methyltransferase Ste14
MHILKAVVGIVWIVFWLFWLVEAFSAKESVRSKGRFPLGGLSVLTVIVLLRFLGGGGAAVHSVVAGAIGTGILLSGLGLAVWARVHLGRNWGMPMTRRAEPELVTSGPYRIVRHPIYSGLLLGVLGTALVTSLIGLVIAGAMLGYFYYAASVEERDMTATFPTIYPAHRAGTKMLIPFVL